ncbi:MAG: hypothetical protein AAGK37_04080 [Pseudomonadota bacterium]
MKHAIVLFAVTAAVLMVVHAAFGYAAAYTLAYGTVVAMAASISATFFWLWYQRQTPLALGMGFSWLGTTGVLGWWWLYQILERPVAMAENSGLFVFVSAYFVGAVLHFRVVGRSLGWGSLVLLLPFSGVLALTVLRFST